MIAKLGFYFSGINIILLVVGFCISASTLAATDPVRSASELDYPPFSIVLENGAAGGFSVELMRAALNKIGRDATYEVGPWAKIKQDLKKGRLEALPLVGRTPEREDVFDFTAPYLRLYGAVFVRDDEKNLKNLMDLKGYRIGVMTGDNAEEFMRRENITDRLITTPSFEEAFIKLANGELDAVVAQRLVGLNLIEKLNLDNLKTAIAPLKALRQDFCFAVTEGNKELLAQLNEGLFVVIADGTYDHLRSKWLGILNKENEKNRFLWVTISSIAGIPAFFILALYFYQKRQVLKKLTESEERLRISQLDGHIGTWEANFITNQEIWSEAVTKELGFPDIAEPTWDDYLATIYPDDRNHVIEQHLTDNQPCDVEYRIVDTQGKIRWMRSIGKAEFDSSGKPVKLRGTVQDITAQKTAEEQLQLFALVFSETNEGITITDANAAIIDVNPAFCDITGYSREEVIGKNPNFLSSGKHSPEFFADMWQTINEQGHWRGEVWNRKKEGDVYAELLTISSILDDDGNVLHYVGLFSDITHSKKQQEELALMAHYDVLTHLPNRILLADRFIQAIGHCKRNKTLLAVCFLDLDNFKPVNDYYGHDVGDSLLIEVAERIKANIRDEDTASRQGGDEFALLLGDIEVFSQCGQMLERIIVSLSQPFLIEQQSITISASIGVSLYPTDDADLDTLMRHADQAMYQAKLAGRNRYHLFNTEQDQQTILKNIQLQEIQDAYSNNEFCLFYQPKVNMKTGIVFGVEALIRWMHSEKGLIPPVKFLPIIEVTEMEIQIGNWVVNEALKQLDFWKKQGIELEVSVNISSYHLQSPSFVAELDGALSMYPDLDSKYLQLEILESSALGDLHAISSIIKTCIHALGINFALDDFGTGYSSLIHLRNLPANSIKIDQTFVRDVLDDPNDFAIIDGVIGLADSFNRQIIAEGVETTEHGLMLLILGCDEAQGYGIARPMPAYDFPEWLNNYTPNQEWTTCGTSTHTLKENKIKLFRLALNQWLNHCEISFQSAPDSPKYWRKIKRKECLCGYWIKRVRQEQLFEENWLERLNEAHEKMHRRANDLVNKYQQGEIDAAREGLNEMRTCFEKIGNILEQSE